MSPRLPRPTIPYAVTAACVVGLLTACGSGAGGDGGSVGPSSMPPSSPSSSPSSSQSPGGPGSTTPSMPPSGRARPTTMSGRVTSTAGGCTVFKNDRDATVWVLIGETGTLRAGTAYRVEGVAMDAMDPACPQGLPFQVTRAIEVGFAEDLPVLPPPRPSGQTETLTGVVSAGVEAGCRVLQTDGGAFVLVGTVRVPEGRPVSVRGVRRDDVMTTCQQGPVFEVQTVLPVQ
ncbi:hypothetical protein [Knoellia flava]|nr:hypothetical protein [Knoellia flava]